MDGVGFLLQDKEPTLLSPERDPPPVRQYHRSVSQWKTFTRCGEQFKLQRMVRPKLPERPASWLVLGQAFHSTFASWELSNRELDPLALFEAQWTKWMMQLQEQQPDLSKWLKPPKSKIENDLTNRKNAGVKMVENYVTDATSGDWEVYVLPDGTKAVELEFSVVFGKTKVVGYIDLLKKWPTSIYPTIEDLKSGNREKSFFQLEVYHHALRQMGIETRYGDYWYAKDRASSGFIPLGQQSDEQMAYYFDTLDTAIDQRLFLPNPGDHCGLCGVKEWCSLMGTKNPDERESSDRV